jgi:hypothetical protein
MRHSLGERERSGAFQSNRNRLGARTVKTGDTGVIPAAMSVLAELDQTQAELQSEFPGWRIWYVYRPGNVSWAARPEPLLNTQSAEDLRAAIAKVLANDRGDVSKVLEDIGDPLVSRQEGYNDPDDTLDLLSVIADEGTEEEDDM